MFYYKNHDDFLFYQLNDKSINENKISIKKILEENKDKLDSFSFET